jgi:hypothetical protein
MKTAMSLPDLYCHVNTYTESLDHNLAGPIILSFNGAGRTLTLDYETSSRFVVEQARMALDRVRGLWDTETERPAWLGGGVSPYAKHKLYYWEYHLPLVPTALGELREMSARLVAYEALADALTVPQLRSQCLPLLHWALLPLSRALLQGDWQDPAVRAAKRSLYGPYLAPYLAGTRYVKNQETFCAYHALDDVSSILIDALAIEPLDLASGLGDLYRSHLDTLEKTGWCDLGANGIVNTFMPRRTAYPTLRVKRLDEFELIRRLGEGPRR